MNVLDSQLVAGRLRACGFEIVDDPDSADVILYNTCSVRDHAEQKVWSRLGELQDARKRRPHLVIGVIGCMAERQGTAMFHKYPHVDLLCGPAELDKLPAMVCNALATRLADPAAALRQTALAGPRAGRNAAVPWGDSDALETLDLSRSVVRGDDAARAYVRVTRGCNKFCSYCIVPYTRGPEVHRPPANIIAEVRKLADAGALEITLLGQTVNHYFWKEPDGRAVRFADLLYMIHEAVPSVRRLRFVTSYPRDFGEDVLAVMRDCPRICRYLHLPAQSGSDRMLRLMRRGYTAAQYVELIDRAREMLPDVSIASDFIAGFPGETEDDHRLSMDLIRRCRFKNSFIFKYSPRPGTAAAREYPDDVPVEVKRRRNNELLAVQQEVALELNRAMVGQTVEVMVEGPSPVGARRSAADAADDAPAAAAAPWRPGKEICQLSGRTRGDQIVCFDGDPSLAGRIVNVAIIEVSPLALRGRLVGGDGV